MPAPRKRNKLLHIAVTKEEEKMINQLRYRCRQKSVAATIRHALYELYDSKFDSRAKRAPTPTPCTIDNDLRDKLRKRL